VRAALPILLLFLVAACATPAPPRPKAGASKPAAARAQQPPGARWRAVPAKADGATVPGGRRHIVKRGETGIAIAKAYGVPWSRIAAANRLGREAVLEIGQPLFVPTAQTTRTTQPGRGPRPRPQPPANATPEEQAAAFDLDIDDLITGSAPATRQARADTQPRPAPAPASATAIPRLAWPVDGRVILSRFGPKPGGRVNDGINIKTLRGAPVRAAADGEILYVGDAIAGFGLMMLIRHPGGAVTAYGHLEDALATRGDKVQRGQAIARAGTSGEAKEPQLQFQLRLGRRALDPQAYLPG
jgi:murein DD-endopeptidase MepM/ murein hydrolase activator NlpD